MKKLKSTDLAKQKRKLEKIFNEYIRRRDTPCECISCDKWLTFEGSQAGHFWSKGAYPAVRFDERNVHVQCTGCNTFRHGNLLEYQPRLIEKIGQDQYDQLKQDRNQARKYTVWELQELIEIYTAKINGLT